MLKNILRLIFYPIFIINLFFFFFNTSLFLGNGRESNSKGLSWYELEKNFIKIQTGDSKNLVLNKLGVPDKYLNNDNTWRYEQKSFFSNGWIVEFNFREEKVFSINRFKF